MINRNTVETQDSDDETDMFADDPNMLLLGFQDDGNAVYQSKTGLISSNQGNLAIESSKELIMFDKNGDPINAKTRRASMDATIAEEEHHPT